MSTTKSRVRSILRMSRVSPKLGLEEICRDLVLYIESRWYEGEYPQSLYSAAYGILHGCHTARVDGVNQRRVFGLKGAAALDYVCRIADLGLSGDDVSRYINMGN